jgi:hypothetical protein
MITQSNISYTEANKKATAQLATIVDETIAFNICHQKSFTAAEL